MSGGEKHLYRRMVILLIIIFIGGFCIFKINEKTGEIKDT